MARLRITARCEADLNALETADAEAILDMFFALRGQAPDAGEPVAGLHQRVCTSLHAGRYRAVTWYDREHDVVWLLMAGIHRADSREDAYARAIALEQAGRLYPADVDYAALAIDEQRERLEQEAQDLARLRDQLLQSGAEQVLSYTSPDDLYAEIAAEFIEELAEVILSVRLHRRGKRLLDGELRIVLAGFFANHTFEERPEPRFRFRAFAAYFPLPPRLP